MSDTNNSSYIISGSTMTLFHNNRMYIAHKEHKLWDKLVQAVGDSDYDAAVRIVDIMQGIREWVSDSERLAVVGEAVAFDARILPNAITKRIIEMVDQGINVDPIERFLINLFNNVSSRAIEELYRFLEFNKLPITTDGHFLAYKRITSDWKDVYSRTISNTVGTVVSMERNMVMDDPNQTCATGLHFASLNYLKEYWGERLVAVKINPADVVSIPVDYNNSKGRCCRYEVLTELSPELIGGDTDAWDAAVVE